MSRKHRIPRDSKINQDRRDASYERIVRQVTNNTLAAKPVATAAELHDAREQMLNQPLEELCNFCHARPIVPRFYPYCGTTCAIDAERS